MENDFGRGVVAVVTGRVTLVVRGWGAGARDGETVVGLTGLSTLGPAAAI